MEHLNVTPRFVQAYQIAWGDDERTPGMTEADRIKQGIEALSCDLGFRSSMAEVLVAEGYVHWTQPSTIKPWGNYLNLGGAIEMLEAELIEVPNKRVAIGWHNPHSYRGYYERLGLEPKPNCLVREMLEVLQTSLGATFQGYKGGDYTMEYSTELYLCEEGDVTDNQIGPLLLELMLAREVPDERPAAS